MAELLCRRSFFSRKDNAECVNQWVREYQVRMKGSTITVVDPSKCQVSMRKIEALDVQMLITRRLCNSAPEMVWTPVQQFPVAV